MIFHELMFIKLLRDHPFLLMCFRSSHHHCHLGIQACLPPTKNTRVPTSSRRRILLMTLPYLAAALSWLWFMTAMAATAAAAFSFVFFSLTL